MAGHDVQYDQDRDLWFADIKVTTPDGNELASYTPFIRFAFARYQPHSIADAHLSKVVTVDYAQIAADRHVTMTGDIRSGFRVTVAGYAPIGEIANSTNAREHHWIPPSSRTTRYSGYPNLTWKPLVRNGWSSRPILVSSLADTDKVTWTGGFNPGNHQLARPARDRGVRGLPAPLRTARLDRHHPHPVQPDLRPRLFVRTSRDGDQQGPVDGEIDGDFVVFLIGADLRDPETRPARPASC